jgi:pilus assembly protein CpaC
MGAIPAGAAYAPTPSPRAGGVLPPGTIVNRVYVPGPRQVLLKVKIAEINRTALRQLGVNWQRITDGAVINSVIGNIGAPGSQLFGVFDEGNFSLYINALRTNSLAKILAEPNLVALDGQPARFLSGGQFPYPVPQSASIPGGGTVITIQFADFGAILQFIPHILDNDSIRLDVSPVFSELNFAAGTSVNGTTVPGINQRSARTVVQIREGQTLAIAGLLQTRTNATTARVPGLGDLPIVGPWFSRNTIETLETELVVLVTPQIVEALEPNEVPPAPGDKVWEPNDWEFFFLGRIEGRTGHPFRATLRELDPLDVMKHFRSEHRWVVGPHGYAD